MDFVIPHSKRGGVRVSVLSLKQSILVWRIGWGVGGLGERTGRDLQVAVSSCTWGTSTPQFQARSPGYVAVLAAFVYSTSACIFYKEGALFQDREGQ
jgi:hypothetical protein